MTYCDRRGRVDCRNDSRDTAEEEKYSSTL